MTLESASQFAAYRPSPRRAIIKPQILTEKNWMILWGEEGTYKSWSAIELAFSVALGQKWMNFDTTSHPVLLINNELPRDDYHQRWIQMLKNRGKCPKNLFVVSDLNMKLDTDTGLGWLTKLVADSKAELVIIDNLYRCFSGEMSSGREVNKFLDNLSFVRDQFNCAICMIAHSRKTSYDHIHNTVIRRGLQDITGSKHFSDNASAIFEVRKDQEKGYPNAIRLIPEKFWYQIPAPPVQRFGVDLNAQFHLL